LATPTWGKYYEADLARGASRLIRHRYLLYQVSLTEMFIHSHRPDDQYGSRNSSPLSRPLNLVLRDSKVIEKINNGLVDDMCLKYRSYIMETQSMCQHVWRRWQRWFVLNAVASSWDTRHSRSKVRCALNRLPLATDFRNS